MIKLVENMFFGIMVSNEELKGYPIILEYTNFSPSESKTIDHWGELPISEQEDIFNFDDTHESDCPIWKKGIDVCDRLLNIQRDGDGSLRYRNYCEVPIVYQHRHPRLSLRSIVNYCEMYDQPKLWWYYISNEQYTQMNREMLIDELLSSNI